MGSEISNMSGKKYSRSRPIKAGKFWSERDAGTVKKMLEEGKTISEIANAVGRTNGSIKARFKIWARKEVAEGGNRDEIFKKYLLLDKDGIVTDVSSGFWIDGEMQSLMSYIQEGKTIAEISKLLPRTENGILNKLKSMARSGIKNGEQKDKVLTKYSIDTEIHEQFESKKDKKVETSQKIITPPETSQKLDTITNQLDLFKSNQEELSKRIDILTNLVNLLKSNQEKLLERIDAICVIYS